MNEELLRNLDNIEKEKNINKELLFEALRLALISACRKTFPDKEDFDVEIDKESGEFRLLEDGKPVNYPEFGRIAAQTAKQVIVQKIREAERDVIYNDYIKRVNDIISGTIHRIEKRAVLIDFGKTEGVLPQREQCYTEVFRQGDPIKVLVVEVKKSSRGPEIILSRSHPILVKRLFELEVPEIADNIVQIKGVAREAGTRTKISVTSSDDKIDCVGSCVGMRGQRVKNVVMELQGEKIDIVRWSEDPETYIRNALSPAELSEIQLDKKTKVANVFVADDQLSLAIGKKGQNVRLASKLTDWKLEVRSVSQKVPISELDGVGAKTETILNGAGIKTLKDLLMSSAEALSEIKGIGPKTAEKIIASAHEAILKEKKVENKLPSIGEMAKKFEKETISPTLLDDAFKEEAKLNEAKLEAAAEDLKNVEDSKEEEDEESTEE